MLTSITPLGERGRGNHWSVTMAALIAGCTLAGGVAFGLAGLLGSVVLDGVGQGARLGLAAAALAAALGAELAGVRIPGPHRQVNEDWMRAFRGWVYGLGFGIQLGAGVATIVTTPVIYAAFVVAFASASPVAGLAIGATFGLVRGCTVLVTRGVRAPSQLAALGRTLQGWESPVRRAALAGQAVLASAALIAAAAVSL